MPELAFLKSALPDKNVQAFLKMIGRSEGTIDAGGYAALFGSTPTHLKLFHSFDDHPRQRFPFTNSDGAIQYSDAAGMYQIMSFVYDDVKKVLGLSDFSPISQDLIALELISRQNCVRKLIAGEFNEVVFKLASTWASLPASPYHQPKHSLDLVTSWYRLEGGEMVG